MKIIFNHTIIVCVAGLCLCFAACKKREDIKASPVKPEKELSDKGPVYPYDRLKTVHLYKDTIYTLAKSPFERKDGEQLIIDEGTIIKVSTGGATNNITIEPGAIIQANGTAENPIVFTSNNYAGNQNVNWGGLIIQGRSYDNANGSNGNPADFSGTLNYVRIEFAPLVLTAVGNRTVIENVMVSYVNAIGQSKAPPAYEIDGGNFNARNLISYACAGPSDFYITRGYSGQMQNILAYRHPFFGGTGINSPYNTLSGVFIENNPNDPSALPYTFPLISNLTVIGPNGQDGTTGSYYDTTIRAAALVTTAHSYFRIRNSLLLGFPIGAWYLDDSLTARAIRLNQSEFTYNIVQSNDSTRAFYLQPHSYFSYTSEDFKNYMMRPQFHDELFHDAADFKFTDPFNYDNPNLLPLNDSPVLSGSNFDQAGPFFNQVSYRGAFGTEDWTKGWANFTPLKTNYNFEH